MSRIHAYLTFNGNCREAMSFYRDCLGGELTFQTVADSPLASVMPVEMKKHILHAMLKTEDLLLMGSDLVGDQGLIRGNAVSLMLQCGSESELKSAYRKLSVGGSPTHPVERTFSGAFFGDLTDKFGNQWLLHFSRLSVTNKTHLKNDDA